MEGDLKAENAREWTYRGEGAVNLVLGYAGISPEFLGKVLRIQKIATNGSDLPNTHTALSSDEKLIWGEMKGLNAAPTKDVAEQKYADLIEAPTKDIAEQIYVEKVMCPLLGPKHVHAGKRILVTKDFLEAVDNNVLSQRPSSRVRAAKVNLLCDSVLLIPDHTLFPHGALKDEFSLCVEIKPKCGFLPASKYISKTNDIKKSVTRFKMHQVLKFHESKVSEISEYDPLDMFSGSKERVHKAVKGLYNTPQNNFRVFLNGSHLFGGLGGGTTRTNCTVGQDFEDVLKHIILAEHGVRTENFLQLVSEALFASGSLDQLLQVQKLDKIDAEGVIHAYYNVIAQPCVVCRSSDDIEFSKNYADLHSVPREDSLRVVRDYLIAATAKDLSMMLSFRPHHQSRDVDSSHGVVYLKSTKQSFDYKVSFVDLDMKPLRKVEYYYELDQQIVRFYLQMADAVSPLSHRAVNGEVSNSEESFSM